MIRKAKQWQNLATRLKRQRCLPIPFVMSAKPSHRSEPTLSERAAAVPWWAWVGTAVLSSLVLGVAFGPEGSEALKYLLPALFIVAGAAALRFRRAAGAAPRGSTASVDVQSLRWREFEALVGRAFELQGYHMNETGVAGSDASIDLLMRKERQTYVVHCKAWRAEKVGIDTVQAARAAMQAHGAVGGFVLSAGRFSREAVAAASAYSLRAVDGPALQALLLQGRAQEARSERTQSDALDTEPDRLEVPAIAVPTIAALAMPVAKAPAAPPAAALAELVLPCPLCGGDMKKRRANRGVNTGQYFWGCLRHPECRGTRRVRPG